MIGRIGIPLIGKDADINRSRLAVGLRRRIGRRNPVDGRTLRRRSADLLLIATDLAKNLFDVAVEAAGKLATAELGLPRRTLYGHRPSAVLHLITGRHTELQSQIRMREGPSFDYALGGIVVDVNSVERRKKCIAVA